MMTIARVDGSGGKRLLALLTLLLCCRAYAGGDPPWLKGKLPPAYDPPKDACYVLLKPQRPYIRSSDEPVCRAILENFNRACDIPPQYDGLKINPATVNLSRPEWKPLPIEGNLDIVKRLLQPNDNERQAEIRWQGEEPRLAPLIAAGTLKLSRADVVGLDGRGGVYSVYRLDNYYPGEARFNQAHVLFAELGGRTKSNHFALSYFLGELVRFDDHWYLTYYSSLDRRFIAMSFVAREGSPIGVVGTCAVQHVSDRTRNK